MDPVALITFWQVARIVLPIIGAIAAASFVIWCAVGYVLWFTRRGLGDDATIESNPDWLESL